MGGVRSGLIVFVCVMLLWGSAFAFDNDRSGFVIGVAGGITPVFDWDVKILPPAFSLNYNLGYGWNKKNIVVIELNRSIKIYSSESSSGKSLNMSQAGIRSLTWYHYFDNEHPSYFTAIGIGKYFGADIDNNLGFVVGAGYEFRQHWHTALYISGTKTDNLETLEKDKAYVQLSIVIMYMLY